ncbi:nitrate respiration regulation accessory nitrate sensor NreA [Staphylococcus saccharolyticus]|uniref:nitrate respiration regulation accessory nitrate sensor NreA n=1 Tax=Staphylococcus saccharolyticus TaxID=33028 RepID=UPI00102DA58F|nr:nitrate respiration regulation accessory nitrate sensor NreA [Staphylococcus saccharolyticus]MBL7584541.1 nitrate respiration regulation accessory nitrate sensor NreA [Staphylococcus saccharolyticus]TAA92037.1 hypothetical protein DMB74_08240 [Staphylococcus saccharolyticus]TAA92377.1 hypothetical protein DMB77_07105 [Staphylococcus saccharolyticus]
MESESLKRNHDLQINLDKLRIKEGYDFGGIALHDHHHTSSPIKWQYVSGNTNDRYKLIILRKGRGLAGMVMKTGKRMVIADVETALSPAEKVKFPIILSESLTAVVAVPLWLNQSMYGVLLLGQRNYKSLPKSLDQLNIEEQLGNFTELN